MFRVINTRELQHRRCLFFCLFASYRNGLFALALYTARKARLTGSPWQYDDKQTHSVHVYTYGGVCVVTDIARHRRQYDKYIDCMFAVYATSHVLPHLTTVFVCGSIHGGVHRVVIVLKIL